MSSGTGSPRVLLGRIAGAHGIKGDVLIRSFTGDPAAVAAYGPLQDQSGSRRLAIRVLRVTEKGVVARIEGIGDRTAAETLKGLELYAERSQLPMAGEREYYHSDLIGLRAVDTRGQPVGEVVAVQNFGAGDLIEIRLDGGRATELVPFTDAFVPMVDVACGRIVVDLPHEAPDDAGEDQP